MPFPATGLLDNFNRASLDANWSDDPFNDAFGNLTLVDSTAVTASGGATAHSWWNVATYGPDSECYVVISTLPANAQIVQIAARLVSPDTSNSTGDAYQVKWTYSSAGNDSWEIIRTVNSADTSLATTSAAGNDIAAGDAMGIEVTGNGATVTIKAKVRQSGVWKDALTYEDTNAARLTAAGYLALLIQDSTARVDDFSGGTFTPDVPLTIVSNTLNALNFPKPKRRR
jgi:hypothetical protein